MLSRKSGKYLFFVASSIFIVIATISPFDFVVTDNLSESLVADRFLGSTNIKDYVRNILLFTSFGIATAKIISDRQSWRWQAWMSSLLLSSIFSITIEIVQIFLPSRVSSISDIVCNGLGGLLGGVLYCWRKSWLDLIKGIITRNYQQINPRFLASVILSYVATIFCGWIVLTSSINLNNWNKDAYLAIASEVTNQVFWRGYITSLYICDRSIDSSEVAQAFNNTHAFFSQSPNLVTSLLFLDYQSSYSDNNLQIPDLHWHQELPAKKLASSADRPRDDSTINDLIHHHKTVLFERRNSLISAAPATSLNQKISAAQEFTLSIIIATNKLKQVGPSRIIALGENIYSRNMMLGQEDSNLVFRLRTSSTGVNATQPGFYIPNFFKDKDLHQILITFSDKNLTFYTDSPKHKYAFVFEPATQSKLVLPFTFKQWNVNLANFNLFRSKVIFYSFVFFPLSILCFIFVLRLL